MAKGGDRDGIPGAGVDRQGREVIDPTRNVLDLVRASIERQDDLRAADRRYYDSESRHTEEMAILRAKHAEQLRVAESERINAIRAVDVGAAAILANQVTAASDALRVQVEATRQQTATGLDAALKPIQNDIADLRRVQYEQAGQKSATVDVGSTHRQATQWLVTTIIAGFAALIGIGAIIAVIIHG